MPAIASSFIMSVSTSRPLASVGVQWGATTCLIIGLSWFVRLTHVWLLPRLRAGLLGGIRFAEAQERRGRGRPHSLRTLAVPHMLTTATLPRFAVTTPMLTLVAPNTAERNHRTPPFYEIRVPPTHARGPAPL
ncbi:hypothetical protein BV22DRAFT_180187 [Leucogyrophana mollusca]|uniref:Uncharacterized protein n=1 Tax=Leucogyrophana mollusca TaxID=85980 RepID=A0ACB8BU05_9AGAM|nr:hypothetical protein BV22DRAFT_180187 [Leucogyrophana mollusca]